MVRGAEWLEDGGGEVGGWRCIVSDMHEEETSVGASAALVTAGLIPPYPERKRDVLTARDWGETWKEVGCRQGRDESGLAAVAICILWWNESPCDAPNSWMHE